MALLQRTLRASLAAHQCFLSPLFPVTGGGLREEACETGLTNQSGYPGILALPLGGPRSQAHRSEPSLGFLSWVEVQGSGVDLLRPSPPGEKATHLQERRDGNQGQTSRHAWRGREGGLVGGGLVPGFLLQVCDTPAPGILTWVKTQNQPMFYTTETNVFMQSLKPGSLLT